MAIVINKTELPSGSILFTVSGVYDCLNNSFEWYLNNNLVGTDRTYTLQYPQNGDEIYVKVKNYAAEHCPIYWHDGQFYGGNFFGNFGGGTFYYGDLNGCKYEYKLPKQKPFIVDFNKLI